MLCQLSYRGHGRKLLVPRLSQHIQRPQQRRTGTHTQPHTKCAKRRHRELKLHQPAARKQKRRSKPNGSCAANPAREATKIKKKSRCRPGRSWKPLPVPEALRNKYKRSKCSMLKFTNTSFPNKLPEAFTDELPPEKRELRSSPFLECDFPLIGSLVQEQSSLLLQWQKRSRQIPTRPRLLFEQ